MSDSLNFHGRLKIAIEFEQQVINYLKKKNNVVALNGTEHTHRSFVDEIRKRRISTTDGLLIRFAPDGIAINSKNEIYYWEAKNSIHVEKSAYKTYMEYKKIINKLFIFIKDKENNVFYQEVERIKFKQDDWQKGNKEKGSGTYYKTIKLSSMKLINDFFKNTER